MPSHKKKNIIDQIFSLQVGIGRKSVYRMQGKILQNLVLSKNRKFKTVRKFQSSGPSMFTLLHYGRIVLHENRQTVQCYSSYEMNGPKLYNFPYVHQCKDLIVWSPDSPLSTASLLAQNERHSTSLLYLTSTRQCQYLERRCALTGKLFEHVYLSASAKLKFAELQCDPESDTVVIKSTKNTQDVSSFITLAIFSSPPLQFSAMFEISKLIFGKRAVDAGIQQGVLFVRHSDNKVKLYSLEYILSKFTVHRYQLGTVLENGDIVGQEPGGLPVTVQILEEPPVLMEITSKQGDFSVGGNPWHYIIKPTPYTAQVCRLGSDDVVARIHIPDSDMETEHVFFHPDESNRLVHMSNRFIKISYIHVNSLQSWLTYSGQDAVRSASHSTTSRYGRSLKPSSSALNALLSNQDSMCQDLSIAYDMDTDLIGVLQVIEEDSANSFVMKQVILYDNVTGEKVRNIDLNYKFNNKFSMDTSSFSIVLDGVQLLAITKHKDQTFGFLSSLVEDHDNPENNSESARQSSS